MRIRSGLLGMSLVAVLCGCMSDTRSGNHTAHTYDCSGTGKGWDDCLDQARTQCNPRGYDIVSQNGDAKATASGTTEMSRVLVVSCK